MIKKSAFFIFTLVFVCMLYTQDYAQDIELQDVSSVWLSSLSVDNSSGVNHLTFLVNARKACKFEPIIDIKKATQKSLEYFFVGLALPNEKFWVNLNPKGLLGIIDSTLVETDLGRVMLNADLRLKEQASELTNPEISPVGREFWKRLYGKAEELGITDNIAANTRFWIVPGEVIVSETDNKLSIVKSNFKVCQESAYLGQKIEIKDKKQKELQDYAFSLIEELIVPSLNKKVNESYSYADLREVYQALILARWYKQKFGYPRNPFLETVNMDILKDTEKDLLYTQDEIYQYYLKSLSKGEYSFREANPGGSSPYSAVTVRQYFSGGIDFINIPNQAQSLVAVEESDSNYFTFAVYWPDNVSSPLKLAKAQINLTPAPETIIPTQPNEATPVALTKNPPQNEAAIIALTKNLPEVTPIRVAKQRIEDLRSTTKADRIYITNKL